MSFLAFPLRFERGFFNRCSREEAIVSLVSVMAKTPHGSWVGSPHFGLREYFEEARAHPELPVQALQELNHALRDLGIVDYRVEEISKESPVSAETDSYVLKIVSNAEGGSSHSLRLA